ncbi:hypothetical protein EJ02DRAFT_501278 [Clathrospora elynae]|uniref:Uncharacterized protein n=1 Tax=Clathrospora elynae TaxID=706981 RepID=A0A6A5SVU5_9PLEO|nr:hypothetical protein EJ02DRAFT_501278 [Clathrospora elynae]
MTIRYRRMNNSLGSSWGDADYASDDAGSVHSASDEASEVDLEGSDKEVARRPDNAETTPQPRKKRNHLSQSTPTTQTKVAPISQRLASARSTPSSLPRTSETPAQEQYEPSFIMPSMDSYPHGYDQSPLKTPQPRNRTRNNAQNRSGYTPGASPRFARQGTLTDNYRQPENQEQEEVSPWHYVYLFWENVASPLVAHSLDIFSYGMRHFVKPFLGAILGIGILVFGIQIATGMLHSALSTAIIGPVCAIPGSSYLFAACVTGQNQQANFEELINVQTRFEDILDASKDTSSLPATIKNSELAIRDLRTLVRYSRLPSRKELDNEFEYFVQTANEASVDLSRYNSRIGAAMDRVIATNTWTMNVIQGISEKETSIGAVSRVVNSMAGAFVAPPLTLQQRIFDQYVLHVGKNKEEITRLIEQAQALLLVLNNLDGRLGTIFEIATGDDQTITQNQEELLGSLWTKLGGNRSDVKANRKSLNLLQNISAYRKKAVMHVSETLLKLQEIQAELENLREGVAAPEVLGYRDEVPLTYHLELIEKGVERLRISRGESMKVESETYKNLMRGGQDGEGGVRELSGPAITIKAK